MQKRGYQLDRHCASQKMRLCTHHQVYVYLWLPVLSKVKMYSIESDTCMIVEAWNGGTRWVGEVERGCLGDVLES
jgi:hypothetical protein